MFDYLGEERDAMGPLDAKGRQMPPLSPDYSTQLSVTQCFSDAVR
jgi:hypothetical protein